MPPESPEMPEIPEIPENPVPPVPPEKPVPPESPEIPVPPEKKYTLLASVHFFVYLCGENNLILSETKSCINFLSYAYRYSR